MDICTILKTRQYPQEKITGSLKVSDKANTGNGDSKNNSKDLVKNIENTEELWVYKKANMNEPNGGFCVRRLINRLSKPFLYPREINSC